MRKKTEINYNGKAMLELSKKELTVLYNAIGYTKDEVLNKILDDIDNALTDISNNDFNGDK